MSHMTKYIFLALILLSCKKQEQIEPIVISHTVRYEVTGDALTCDISYLNSIGATITSNHVALPYHSPNYTLESNKSAYAKVKNFNDNHLIRLSIFVDGVITKQSECSTSGCEVECSQIME